MATFEEIKNAARHTYQGFNKDRVGLTPPVRIIHKINGDVYGAWSIFQEGGLVALVGHDGLYPIGQFDIHSKQGRIPEEKVPESSWTQLEDFLNDVANERVQDDDGPGSAPNYNAKTARDMLDRLWLERRKPAHII